MTKRISTLLAVLGLAVAAPGVAQARHGADDDPATHGTATTTVVDDHGGDRPAGVSDDPVDHDATDDKGGERAAGVSDDDPATHDAGDDKGGERAAGVSDDDPATHDAGDDKAAPAKKAAKAKKKAKRKHRNRGRRHAED